MVSAVAVGEAAATGRGLGGIRRTVRSVRGHEMSEVMAHRKRGERIAQEAVLRRGVCGRVGANLLDHLGRRHLGARSRDAGLAHAERHDARDMWSGGARARC